MAYKYKNNCLLLYPQPIIQRPIFGILCIKTEMSPVMANVTKAPSRMLTGAVQNPSTWLPSRAPKSSLKYADTGARIIIWQRYIP